MNMLKKKVSLCLLLLVFMLPCASMAETAVDADIPVFEWERDAKEHWHVLENGEKADAAPHVMQDVFCEVCDSEIWVFDDGWADVSNYNEYGELTRSTSYDDTGAVSYDCVFAYGYDENGIKLWEKQFENGWFAGEMAYAVNADGENLPIWSVTYYDDGTSGRIEYDGQGNAVKSFTYDADGTVTYESTSEFALGSDGWYYEAKTTAIMDGTVFTEERNEHGDWTYASIIESDGTVVSETVFEYVYQDGVKASCKQYESGVLTMESYYDEWGRLVKEIEYLEDGSTLVYEFDEEGNLINK